MIIKYNKNIGEKAIGINLTRLINQTYKLLPMREENLDWEKKLDTIIEEFAGMDQILINQHEILFQLLCKLQGLNTLKEDESFSIYRGIIFECINLIVELKSNVC